MKKGLSLILAIAMVFSMFASVAFAAETKTPEQMFEALKEKGIFSGYTDGSAGLDKTMTRAQVSVVVTKLLGLTEDKAEASVFTDLKDAQWAAGSIGAAVKADLMVGKGGGKFDPSGKFTTEQLAVVMVKAQKLAVSTDAVEGTVSNWAKGYVAAAIKAGLIVKADDYTTPAPRSVLVATTYAVDQLIVAGDKLTATVKQTGAKELTLTFNKAAAADVKVAVKSAFLTVDGKVEFAADRKSAVFTAADNETIVAGEYTVEVTGVDAVKVTIEAAKLVSLKWTATGLKAQANNVVKFEGVDQFGKKFDVNSSDITAATAYNVTDGAQLVVNKGDNKLTITSAVAKDKEVLINVIAKGLQIQTTVKVAAASVVSSVKIGEVKPLGTNTRINVGETVVVPVTLIDQYNEEMTLDTTNMGSVLFVSSNTSVIASTYTGFEAKDSKNIGLRVVTLVDGETTLTVIVPSTATQASTKVTVSKAPALASLTLTQPTGSFYANEKIKIGFEAKDQYGAKVDITNISALSAVTFFSTNTDVINTSDLAVEDGKYLTVTPAAEGTTSITAIFKGVQQGTLSFSVNKAATAAKIDGLKDGTVTRFVYNATKGYEIADFVVRDSYNRVIDKDHPNATLKGDVAGATIVLEKKDTNANKVTVTSSTYVTGTADLGAQDLKVTISRTTGADARKFTLTKDFSVQSVGINDVVKYEADLPAITTILVQGTTGYTADHRATFALKHGLDKDGNKVQVTDLFDSLTSSDNTILTADRTTGKVTAIAKGEAAILAVKNGKQVALVTIKASEDRAVQTSLSFDKDVEKEVKAGTTLTLNDNLVVKDQYGVTIAANGQWIVSDTSVLTATATAGIYTVKADYEGEVTVTFVSSNAKMVETKIVIKK